MQRLILALVGLALLAACATQVTVPHYPEITFAHRPVISLDVAEIKIIRAYQPGQEAKRVESKFPVLPVDMAARWAEDRLRAVGTLGVLTYVIEEAGVTEVPLQKKDGLEGLITIDQSERYEATLIVTLSVDKPTGGRSADTTVTVKRSQTVAEDVTLNEREMVWYRMTEALAGDLDAQLDRTIPRYFSGFLY